MQGGTGGGERSSGRGEDRRGGRGGKCQRPDQPEGAADQDGDFRYFDQGGGDQRV